MIGKQSKGRGFRGALNYVLGKEGAEIIGGNMLGESARALSAEFGETRKLKPNLSRVVYHASLSLPPGEKLSDGKWAEVADRYMEGMGFKGAQYVAVKHTDTNHSHIHIIASRIKMDGKVVSESHDYKRSETHIRGLEQEFGLTPTTPSRGVGIRAPTTGELHKALRENQPSTKLRLQNIVQSAVPQCATMSDFVSHLENRGVAVVPNVAKTGHVTGISFRIDGEMMKGSDLGRSFTWQGIQKQGITYEQNRDFERISQKRGHSADLVRHWASDSSTTQGRPGKYQGPQRDNKAIGGSHEQLDWERSANNHKTRERGGRYERSRREDKAPHSRICPDGRVPQRDRTNQVSDDSARNHNARIDHNSEHIMRLAVEVFRNGQKRKEMGSLRGQSLATTGSAHSDRDQSGLKLIEQALKPIDDEREKEIQIQREERRKQALERAKTKKRDRGFELSL